jgi:hypothetical protein
MSTVNHIPLNKGETQWIMSPKRDHITLLIIVYDKLLKDLVIKLGYE